MTEAEAANRLMRLAKADRAPRPALSRPRTRPRFRDAEYDALVRENARAGGRSFRIWSAPIRRRSGWARRRPRRWPRCRMPGRCSASTMPFRDEEVREFVARVRRFLNLPAGRAGRDDRRAEDRRAVLLAALREGQLVLAATRGDGAVGEDVTPNVRTISGHPAARSPARPTSSKCAARFTCRRPTSPP